MGASAATSGTFTIDYPANYETPELAGARMDYVVNVKGIRKKELLPLDDEFAKEVSDVETLEALRDRIREDLQRGAEQDAEHAMRHELVKELASRMKAPPDVLVEQEVDRRLEEFVRRLVEQGIDPDEGRDRLARVPRPAAGRGGGHRPKHARHRRNRAARVDRRHRRRRERPKSRGLPSGPAGRPRPFAGV